MAKRSARQKARELQHHEPATVHPLFPHERGWSPHEHDQQSRDRKYVKNVRAMSPMQQRLMNAIDERSVVVALGPAGTGKTYLAIAKAVEALEAGRAGTHRAVAAGSRGAGESLGFLPGAPGREARALSAPALRRADRAAGGTKRLKALVAEGTIEIAPVAYMRGAHAQRLLHRHRRGAELHLRPAQDAADAARLALDHGP